MAGEGNTKEGIEKLIFSCISKILRKDI